MPLTLHRESHLDHGLSKEQVAFLLERFKDREAFFCETVELPAELGTVPCALHLDVPEAEVFYAKRGERPYESRMCNRPQRAVREVTVVAGPHDGLSCVLFTAYGGPLAPMEPGDSRVDSGHIHSERVAFWARAALSAS